MWDDNYNRSCGLSIEDLGLEIKVPDAIMTDKGSISKPDKSYLTTVDGEVIDPEKVKAMQAYAAKLLKSSPKMKAERVKRKVAEQFKIKLA